jgi:hypothetical protein
MTKRESYTSPEFFYSDEEQLAAFRALVEWASHHTNERVSILPPNPDEYPFQKLEVIELPADPDIEIAKVIGLGGMGDAGYQKLLADLCRFGFIQELNSRTAQKKSSLMAYAHLKSIDDVPIGHNAAFVASGENDFAYKNGMIANHMVKFLEIDGIPAPLLIQKSGFVLFGYPLEGALGYGVPKRVIESGNRALIKDLKPHIDAGVVIHTAPSETRGKDILLADGTTAKMVTRVEDSFARLVKKRLPLAAALPMDIQNRQGFAELVGPISVFDESDVHYLMERSAKILTEMTGTPAVYGLPEGAQLIENSG